MSRTPALSSGLASSTGSASENSVSSLDVASAIGTWIAAFLALIALIGIVAPYLALRATLSERNRALNAVYDRRGTYMTRGIRVTRHLRVLRRMRLPDLAPRYVANDEVDGPLLAGAGAEGVEFAATVSTTPWTLGLAPVDYAEWNTGWAKLATLLLRGYTVGRRPLTDLGIAPRGGTLEAVNDRTALVVSRHWLLLLGLLGRYGHRRDKGVLRVHAQLRRRDDGERLHISSFARSTLQMDSSTESSEAESGDISVMGDSSSDRSSTGSDFGSDFGSDSGSDTDSSYVPDRNRSLVLCPRRTAFGVLFYEEPHDHETVHGITGTLRDLGRHRGSWSHMSTVAFVPHAANEIAAPGLPPKTDAASLDTLFWLANGFLPAGLNAAGHPVVLSLEGPPPLNDVIPEKRIRSRAHRLRKSRQQAFSLQPCTELPLSLGTAMRGLGIQLPEVLHFLPVPAGAAAEVTAAAVHEHENKKSGPSGDLLVGAAGMGGWACWRHRSSAYHCLVSVSDLTRLVAAFLALPSDPWGFLCGKEPFWRGILHPATRMMQHADVVRLIRAGALPGVPPDTRAFHWRLRGAKFYQAHTSDCHALDNLLSTVPPSPPPHASTTAIAAAMLPTPLRTMLGVLSILDASYRRLVLAACALLTGDEDGNDTEQRNSRATRKDRCRKSMRKTLEAWQQLTDHATRHGSARGSFTMYVPRWQSLDTTMQTLADFGVTYEQDDAENPRRLRFGRRVSATGRQFILAYGQALAQLRVLEAEDHLGRLSYDAAEKTLSWFGSTDENGNDGPLLGKWPLDVPLVAAAAVPAAPPVVDIAHTDAVRAALWAVNRARMWLSNPDAEPLLAFYGELDPHVYVM